MSAIFSLCAVAALTQATPKPYADVVTGQAQSQPGLFTVHQVGEKHYFEIPADKFGRDMLWQAQQESIPVKLGGPGLHNYRLVNWTRRGSKVYLNSLDISTRAAGGQESARGVALLTPPSITAAFNVEAEGANGSAVIDVTNFLTSDPPELNVAQSWNASVASDRSYVERIKAHPQNIEVRSLITYRLARQDSITGTASSFANDTGPSSSVMMHYSFIELPEKPMVPRYRDPRVGFFGVLYREVGGPQNRVVTRDIVRRYRLEKKNPEAPISEPVKPITFVLAPEVPQKWHDAIRRGIEAWEPAFRQAGFEDAVRCVEAPTPQEDPDWSAEDIGQTVVRWTSADTENAYGVQVVDPRSGEVISGQLTFYHNFLSWLQNLYFSQVGALDPRAARFPFGDELMNELVEYIITHEVGHVIGLEHNMRASSTYSIAQLRDRDFVAKNGIASTIMDYARFNYVAQPGDNVSLRRGLGDYDRFAVEWGYKPVPGARSPADERAALASIVARQNLRPELRFGNYNNPLDPNEEPEDIGDNPIEAARLGMLNLRRNARLLVDATHTPGEDTTQLRVTYAMFNQHRRQMLEHVIRTVGAVHSDTYLADQGGPIFRPVPASRQREAVKFLAGEEGMAPPEMIYGDISKRLFATGSLERAIGHQSVLIFSLFIESRIVRMMDNEAANPGTAYTVKEMLQDVQEGVWRDLVKGKPQINAYQRQFQRNYLIILDGKLNGSGATKTDLMMHGRASLRALAKRIDKAIPRAADEETRLHLSESRRMIEKIINGTSPAVTMPVTTAPGSPPANPLPNGRTEPHGCCFPGAD